jgi:glycosyltransferase involved in cell wall biosynthesis
VAEPRVSVIMPAYNAEATIEAALGSVLAQTSRELEVIVVDDGSTDATAAIAARLASDAPIPVRIVSQDNQGRAAARDAGMDVAAGRFFGFVDADDAAEPTMFAALLARADATGADLVVCPYLGVDGATGEVKFAYQEGSPALYGGTLLERPGLLPAIAGSVCNKLIDRRLFEEGGIDFPNNRDFEDLAVVYRLMGEARCIEKVAEPLYRYRQGGPESVMAACDERYLQIFDALEVTNDHFRRRGDFEALFLDLELMNYTHVLLGRLEDLLRFGPADVRHEFIDQAFAHMDLNFPGWRHEPALRAASGRLAKWVLATNKPLLTVYTDLTAKAAR